MRRQGRAVDGTECGFSDHRKEAFDDGFFRQADVSTLRRNGAGKEWGEEDEGRSGARTLEVREDVAALFALEPVVDDDDVRDAVGGVAPTGETLRRARNEAQAGFSVENVLDKALKGRRFHCDEDIVKRQGAPPGSVGDAFEGGHDGTIEEGRPAVD